MLHGVEGLPTDERWRSKLAAYWWRRAEGEMTSWVGFRHVLADLKAAAAPNPLVELAERAVQDEYAHSMFCRDWAVSFGHPGGEVQPRTQARLAFSGASDSDNRKLRILMCCFTETVGCVILQHVREVVTHPELLKLNRRHLADELQHSRVGWGYLASLHERDRDLIRDWAPRLLELLPEACCDGPEEDLEELIPWGYFTPRLLREAHAEAVRELIVPGLAHLGLTTAEPQLGRCQETA